MTPHAQTMRNRWETFCAALNQTMLRPDAPDDPQFILAAALERLVESWPARAGAISVVLPLVGPVGVRVGTLPYEAQRVIARQTLGGAVPLVERTAIGRDLLLTAPMVVGGEAVGALYVLVADTRQPASDLHFAAQLIGYALEHNDVLQRLRRDLREWGLIASISRTLNTTLDLRMLLQELIADARMLLQAQAASVLLVDDRRKELVFEVVDSDTMKQPTFMRMPMHQGIAGAVVESGEPLMIDDVTQDPRFFGDIDRKTGMLTRSIVAVPLLGRQGVVGVLEVLNRQDGSAFTPHDLELASVLAGQAAVAVENARLYEELRAERDRLLRREYEVRAQIGRDLHDGPVQQVAAAGMHVNLLRTIVKRDPKRLPEALDDLDTQLKQATHDLRTVLYELRPLGIEQEGLYVVLERYVEKFRDPHGVQLHLEMPSDLRRLPPNREAPTLIIVQEAVNNVRKHAQAKHVYITLRDAKDMLVVSVRDDGKGFDVAALEEGYIQRGSFGLLNMRERAELIGGTWQIESAKGQGTTVTIRVPFVVKPSLTDAVMRG